MTTPHSADALKQPELLPCAFCGERLIADCDDGATFHTHPKNDCLFSEWEFGQLNLAAWNRRPTPASPGLDNEAAARLRKQAEEAKKVRGVVALSPEDAFALLDRLERAEADTKHYSMGANPEAKSADEWRERALRAEAAAGAVPEGMAALKVFVDALDAKKAANEVGEPGFEHNDTIWANLEPARQALAAAPPAQGLPAAPRALVTPDMAGSPCDRCGASGWHMCEVSVRPAAAPSEPVGYVSPQNLAALKSGAPVTVFTVKRVGDVELFATPPAQATNEKE